VARIGEREFASILRHPVADERLLGSAWRVLNEFNDILLTELNGEDDRHMRGFIGIAIVFFLHGLGLSFSSLRQGLLSWRIHVVVQAMTFAIFPLVWLLADAMVGRWLPRDLALGFYYL